MEELGVTTPKTFAKDKHSSLFPRWSEKKKKVLMRH